MRDLFSAADTLGDPPYEAIAQGAVLLRGYALPFVRRPCPIWGRVMCRIRSLLENRVVRGITGFLENRPQWRG
jgi:hypothetical protein